MAETFSHSLTKTQARTLTVLFEAAAAAKIKADTYFQGVVDGIPVPDGVDYAFRLNEDASAVICSPQVPAA